MGGQRRQRVKRLGRHGERGEGREGRLTSRVVKLVMRQVPGLHHGATAGHDTPATTLGSEAIGLAVSEGELRWC